MPFDIDSFADFLRQWGEMSPRVAVILTFVFIFIGLTPIPRTFLTIAAGVVYGMAAVPIIIPSTTIGCLIVFWLVRYFFGARAWRFVERRPKLIAIMDAVDAEGWRIVGLCRIASPIPSLVQNVLFGLTRIGTWPFTWATFLFIIPQGTLYVYLGTIGKQAMLGELEGVKLGVMVAGGVMSFIVVALIVRRVRANLNGIERRRTSAAG